MVEQSSSLKKSILRSSWKSNHVLLLRELVWANNQTCSWLLLTLTSHVWVLEVQHVTDIWTQMIIHVHLSKSIDLLSTRSIFDESLTCTLRCSMSKDSLMIGLPWESSDIDSKVTSPLHALNWFNSSLCGSLKSDAFDVTSSQTSTFEDLITS